MGDECRDQRKLNAEIKKLEREADALRPVHRWMDHFAKLAQLLAVVVGVITFGITLDKEREERRDRDFQTAVSLAADSPTLAAGALVAYGERAIPLLVAITAAPEESEWPNAATVAVDSLDQIDKPLTDQQDRRLDSAYRRAVDEAYRIDRLLSVGEDPDADALRHRLRELVLFLDSLCALHPCPPEWPETLGRFETAYPELKK